MSDNDELFIQCPNCTRRVKVPDEIKYRYVKTFKCPCGIYLTAKKKNPIDKRKSPTQDPAGANIRQKKGKTSSSPVSFSSAPKKKSFTDAKPVAKKAIEKSFTDVKPVAKKAMKKKRGQEVPSKIYSDFLVECRDILYTRPDKPRELNMMRYLQSGESIQEMIDWYKRVKNRYNKELKPSSKWCPPRGKHTTSAKAIVNETRSDLETRTTMKEKSSEKNVRSSAIDTQCFFSIGEWECLSRVERKFIESDNGINIQKIYDNVDFNRWEKTHCWLCGLPLCFEKSGANTGSDKYPHQPISCEHKLPVMEMMLFGAGLQTAIDENKMDRINSTANTPVKSSSNSKRGPNDFRRLDDASIPSDWKETVRSEAYGWSHHWCNMRKNALPFITVRNWSQGGANIKFLFIIEINNIYQFVSNIFDLDAKQKEILRKAYKIPKPLSPDNDVYKNSWDSAPNPIETWCEIFRIKVGSKKYNTFKVNQAKNAFENIVKMLIPTFYLLNSGKESVSQLKNIRDTYYGPRTMFKKIDETSIVDRFKDNFLRFKGLWKWSDSKLKSLIDNSDFPNIILQMFDTERRASCNYSRFGESLDFLFKLDDNKEELNKLIRENTMQIDDTHIKKMKIDILEGIQEEVEEEVEEEVGEDEFEQTQLLSLDYENPVDEAVVGGGKRKKKKRTKRKRKRKKKSRKKTRKKKRKKTRKKKRKKTRKRK